jgi:hypothetical protein
VFAFRSFNPTTASYLGVYARPLRMDTAQLTLVRPPFDHPDFLFELNHDGFRALVYISEGRCELVSRRSRVNVFMTGSATVQVVGDFSDRHAHFRPCCTHRDSPALLDLPFKPINHRYLVLQTHNEVVVQSRCQTARETADNSTTFSSFLNEIHYHDRRRHNLQASALHVDEDRWRRMETFS